MTLLASSVLVVFFAILWKISIDRSRRDNYGFDSKGRRIKPPSGFRLLKAGEPVPAQIMAYARGNGWGPYWLELNPAICRQAIFEGYPYYAGRTNNILAIAAKSEEYPLLPLEEQEKQAWWYG